MTGSTTTRSATAHGRLQPLPGLRRETRQGKVGSASAGLPGQCPRHHARITTRTGRRLPLQDTGNMPPSCRCSIHSSSPKPLQTPPARRDTETRTARMPQVLSTGPLRRPLTFPWRTPDRRKPIRARIPKPSMYKAPAQQNAGQTVLPPQPPQEAPTAGPPRVLSARNSQSDSIIGRNGRPSIAPARGATGGRSECWMRSASRRTSLQGGWEGGRRCCNLRVTFCVRRAGTCRSH